MRRILLHIVLLLGLGLPSAFGQFASQGAFPFLDIRPFMSMQVEVVNGNLEYTFVQPEDYENGISKSSVFRVSIKSNNNWRVSVSSVTPFFTPVTLDANSQIPVSILSLKKSNTPDYSTLSTTMAEVASGNRGGTGRAGNTFFLDLQADPGPSYDGGSYIVDLVFTITSD